MITNSKTDGNGHTLNTVKAEFMFSGIKHTGSYSVNPNVKEDAKKPKRSTAHDQQIL